MIYDVNSLLSVLRVCYGEETVYIKTPNHSYVVNGYEFDDDGDIFLLTEKMGC